jgi:hypothetical protein
VRWISLPLPDLTQPLHGFLQSSPEATQRLREFHQPFPGFLQRLKEITQPLKEFIQPLRGFTQRWLGLIQSLCEANQSLRDVWQPLSDANQPSFTPFLPKIAIFPSPRTFSIGFPFSASDGEKMSEERMRCDPGVKRVRVFSSSFQFPSPK